MADTSKGVLFLPSSDAYVRSFHSSAQPQGSLGRTAHGSLSEQRYQEAGGPSLESGSRAGQPHSSLRLQSRKSTGKHSASQHSLALSRRKVAVDYVKGSDLLPGKWR